MASFGDVLTAMRDYRIELERQTQAEVHKQFSRGAAAISAFSARGGVSAFSTPLTNVHAVGVGVRVRNQRIMHDNFVIKVYVYDKLEFEDVPSLTKEFGGIEVDIEALPIQLALAKRRAVATSLAQLPNREKHRPIMGGLSISPLNEAYVGTLGCFIKRVTGGTEQIFALSNNHVLADTNRLAIGTAIVQPGPEVVPTSPDDVFVLPPVIRNRSV